MGTIDSGLSTDEFGRTVLKGAATLSPMRPTTVTTNSAKRKQTANRFGILNGFVDCAMPGLSRVELGTWLVLYRDTRQGVAVTSQADIARRIGATDRAVRSAIGRLAKLGLVVVIRRGGLLQGPSKYRVATGGKG